MRSSRPNKSDDNQRRSQKQRSSRFETFEPRHMMTANPISDVDVQPLDQDLMPAVDQIQIAPSLAEANAASGVDYVHEEYGFDGSGQTVAVIDSGIAWDHYALGGGFGEDHRVVGGWDFAENDSNPYDDGPVGFHGSHVAGIIGSDDVNNQGVASGADLVALRVFDDYGAGEFEWVEQALQWVHDHRNDFENPITTVNLSLGTKWNAETVPEWATLENEFAQLEQDGIFISVAAGNSFKSYGEKGLSYPAVSDHVVPVGSHGADGTISDFSQRNERILVAPGEQITSTVPEHVLGGRGAAKSFFSASGTSMATPYVAGASVLLRQAMQFAGYENITQDSLYDTFRDTADTIYDSITNTNYAKLNLGRAIDSVVSDVHGNNVNSATDLGQLTGTQTVSGTISRANDLDYVTFTAGSDGRVSFTVDTTHELSADIGLIGGQLTREGDTYSFETQAGKAYTLHLGSEAGIGHYDVNLQATAQKVTAVGAQDWGDIAMKQISGIDARSESWHQFNASRNGIVTVELTNPDAGGNVRFDVYDSNLRLVDSNISGNESRIDFVGSKGDSYFVRFEGGSENTDVRITNLVELKGSSLRVSGTARADQIDIDLSSGASVTVNGVAYEFTRSEVNHLVVRSGKGLDSVSVQGGSASESVIAYQNGFKLFSNPITVRAHGSESISFNGGGGMDRINFLDTIGDEAFVSRNNVATLTGAGYENIARGFERVYIDSVGGNDTATLYDTTGNDRLVGIGTHVRLRGSGQFVSVKGFDSVEAISRFGSDVAVFHDTAGDDSLVSRAASASISSDNYQTITRGFETVSAISTRGGHDVADMFGTNGNDLIISKGINATIRGDGMFSLARGFSDVNFHGLGGVDSGRFFLSGESNLVDAAKSQLSFTSELGRVKATGLSNVKVLGGEGVDSIVFSEIGRLDEVIGGDNLARVRYNVGDQAVAIIAKQFDRITALTDDGSLLSEIDAVDFLFSSDDRWQ